MPTGERFVFPPFHLDVVNKQLWRDAELLHIRPKTLAVLQHLLEHAGRLVTKEELIKTVWPDTRGTERLPKQCIRELRALFNDDADTPRFIETQERHGYRFIGQLNSQPSPSSNDKTEMKGAVLNISHQPSVSVLQIVGRDKELSQLATCLQQALAGERQLLFVTGEPGIGKTTVADAFMEHLFGNGGLWIGRGQCVEHYGTGEAYLPILEALGQICRKEGNTHFVELLSQHAPTWLAQMPALLTDVRTTALQRQVQGATAERMLRELAEALEILSAEAPIVLILEDLHWSDTSTVTLLSYLGLRRQPARFLILGTYRPVDVIVHNHPLRGAKQELLRKEKCLELPLAGLTEKEIYIYLTNRFAENLFPQTLAKIVHQRTGGNPFFLASVVDEWISQGILRQCNGQWELQSEAEGLTKIVPANARELIQEQINQLNEQERRILEGASLVGIEFATEVVAAGIGMEAELVEELCNSLNEKHLFIKSLGSSELPEGKTTMYYRFLHALYQSALYDRIPPIRRGRLHQSIGEKKEAIYQKYNREIAPELAVHFEESRDYERALGYIKQAGANALHKSAHQEVIQHLSKGLAILKRLPDTPEHVQQELLFQLTLGISHLTTKGHTATEAEKAYLRAQELAKQVGSIAQLFQATLGLLRLYAVRGNYKAAHELGEECLELAQGENESTLLSWAHCFLGETSFYLGRLSGAQEYLDQGISAYHPVHDHPLSYLYGQDPKVGCLYHAALCLWLRGYPDRALVNAEEAIVLAKDIARPFSLAGALNFAAATHQFRGETQATQQRAEQALALAMEHGFPQWLMVGMILRGWALAAQGKDGEGIPLMVQGLNAQRESGALMSRPYFYALLVDVYQRIGKTAEGLAAITEALEVVRQTEEHVAEGELHRLKGILLLQAADQQRTSKVQKEAEGCFLQAIDLARQQQAKSLELRAQINLSRLWRQQRKTDLARTELTKIYKWFAEGAMTEDHDTAKNLLRELNNS